MAYDKAYYEANKEKIKDYHKAYYEANKEQIKAKNKAYREANKEKKKAIDKAYYEANKEKRKAYDKAYYEANKEKKKAYDKSYHLKYKYNMTLKEKNLMLKKQNTKCKICNIKFRRTFKATPCIDHCHTTNKVRGILCTSCNIGLGHFKDSTEILTNAINYLKETETLPEELR